MQAAALYGKQLSSVLAIQPALLTGAVTAWQNGGLPSITIAPSDVLTAQIQIAQSGFDTATVAALQQLGLSNSDIAALERLEIGIDPNTAAGTLPDKLNDPSLATAVQTAAQDLANVFSTVTMFSTFSTKVETSTREFELVSNFTLGSGSTGINPSNQRLVLALGSYAVTLPPNSFHLRSKGNYVYEGTVNHVSLEARIVPSTTVPNSYTLTMEGSTHVDLSSPIIELTIGNDMGIGAVKLDASLQKGEDEVLREKERRGITTRKELDR